MKRRFCEHLEAVSVCVGYGDFLAETLRFNLPLFERYVIVTTPDDYETRDLCRKWNVECLQTQDGRRHTDSGSGFNKGRMVERGLQHLSANGWRLHLDADIILPHRFRHLLEVAELCKDTVYGVDRVMVRSKQEWQRMLNSGFLQGGHWDYHCRSNFPDGFQMGTRWVHPQMGYCPIGFFQLFHSSQDEWHGIRAKAYPSEHGSACRTDVQFAMKFDRYKRALIPELLAVHLESERAVKGANWKGRTTKRFNESLGSA